MIKGFENEVHIVNQHGLQIPISIISWEDHIYYHTIEKLREEGCADPASISNAQKFIDKLFEVHTKYYDEDHVLNKLKSESELEKYIYETEFKRIITIVKNQKNSICIYANYKELSFLGIKLTLEKDINGNLSEQTSEVTIYATNSEINTPRHSIILHMSLQNFMVGADFIKNMWNINLPNLKGGDALNGSAESENKDN